MQEPVRAQSFTSNCGHWANWCDPATGPVWLQRQAQHFGIHRRPRRPAVIAGPAAQGPKAVAAIERQRRAVVGGDLQQQARCSRLAAPARGPGRAAPPQFPGGGGRAARPGSALRRRAAASAAGSGRRVARPAPPGTRPTPASPGVRRRPDTVHGVSKAAPWSAAASSRSKGPRGRIATPPSTSDSRPRRGLGRRPLAPGDGDVGRPQIKRNRRQKLRRVPARRQRRHMGGINVGDRRQGYPGARPADAAPAGQCHPRRRSAAAPAPPPGRTPAPGSPDRKPGAGRGRRTG